ncbi:MAG: hypothetical protein JXP34_13410 [Planctomycetes bacterium]|nr:hypothetical protein [Planctomycetota bacterium]
MSPGKGDPAEPAEPILRDREFEAFRREKWKDAAYNDERLGVRRRLAAIAGLAGEALAAGGIRLEARASLHHPYTFNRFCVDTQFAYLSRSKAERKPLKTILGVDLGKDIDTDYTHLIFYVEIRFEGLEVGLKLHKDAWWDGQNLKRKVAADGACAAFAEILNALPPGFALSIHDWRRRYEPGAIHKSDVNRVFGYYTPGEHWLHIRREIPRGDPRMGTRELTDAIVSDLAACGPAYRFALWTPENDFLFGPA